MRLQIRSFALLACMLMFSAFASALTVDHLRVNGMENPFGVDINEAVFSWQISGEERGIVQSEYKISILNAEGSVVYETPTTQSEESINVRLESLSLQSSTRYWWSVTVKDNYGNVATSDCEAYFDTGLASKGLNDALWIKGSTSNYGTVVTSDAVQGYTIEAEMQVDQLAAGLCFAASDESNFYMWQLNIYDNVYRLRPHRAVSGSLSCLEEVDLPADVDISAGTRFKLRIEVSDDASLATTYINDIFVDERRGDFTYGTFGIRCSYEYGLTEQGTFYSLLVTSEDGTVLHNLSFDGDNPFNNGTISNGALTVVGQLNSDVYAWLVQPIKDIHYTVEADLTLIRDNAAIVFSATGSQTYFMWQVNTFDYGTPYLRCHIYNNSSSPLVYDYAMSAFTTSDFLNTQKHITISVEGNEIKTYIGEVLVNTFEDNSGALDVGDVGMRVDNSAATPKEEAYFDNIKVTLYDEANSPSVTLFEDFEDANACLFLDAAIEEYGGSRQCHMVVADKELRVMQEATMGMPVFRTVFSISKPVKSAYLYSSALGVYDLKLNTQRVGALQSNGETIYDELKPGWTDYSQRVFYSQYSVAHLLREGLNAIAATVTPGWWRGEVARGFYGARNDAFIASLVVFYEDGTQEIFNTDTSWAVAYDGCLRSGDIYNGEEYDARRTNDYSSPDISNDKLYAVAQDTQFKGVIQAYQGPNVRTLDELMLSPQTATLYNGTTASGSTYGQINVVSQTSSPQSIALSADETLIIDFGQNFAGWVTFNVSGDSGTRLHLRFAEILNDTGDASRANDGPGGSIYTANLRDAKAELYYTLKGGSADEGETYQPSTTFWGYRYCEVTTTGDVTFNSINGLPISSSYIDTGSVQTSSDIVNQLFSNIVWGQRSNLLSVPTDCPQRDERMGWTADTQVFSTTGMLNADMAPFYHKWITDIRDGQRADGAYYCIAPTAWTMCGQAAWSDAGIIVPWNVYMLTGDKEILREHFASMELYMDWLSTQSGDGYKYNGAGTDYGDWLSFATTDSRYVSVAYYANDAQLMSKMARVLSTEENDAYALAAEKYEELFNNIVEEYTERYCNSAGTLRQQTQTANLLMLKFGLYTTERQRETAITRLERDITNNGEKLSTGFLGTSVLNQTLSTVGLNDKAYNLLLQRDCPSWLYSIDQGATTIWERWNSYTLESGFGDAGMNSFNHYAYGAIGEWMYRYMVGIDLDEAAPAYKHIILKPYIDSRSEIPSGQERIHSAQATYQSYYGPIAAAWTALGGKLDTYNVTVPANTSATVYLPVDDEERAVYEGGRSIDEVEDIQYLGYEEGYKVYSIGSGEYKFSTDVALGISKVKKEDYSFSVRPNPVSGLLNIYSSDNISRVELYSLAGMKVSQVELSESKAVDMTAYANGSYLLRAIGEHGIYTEKVLKI